MILLCFFFQPQLLLTELVDPPLESRLFSLDAIHVFHLLLEFFIGFLEAVRLNFKDVVGFLLDFNLILKLADSYLQHFFAVGKSLKAALLIF